MCAFFSFLSCQYFVLIKIYSVLTFFTVHTGCRLPPPQVSRSVIISDLPDTSLARSVDYPHHFPSDPNTDPNVQIIHEVEIVFDREDTCLNLKNIKKNIRFISKE